MDPSDSLETLLDLTQDKIVVVDAEGTYLYANAATERILGYEREAFVGTNTFEYIHPDDVDAVRAVFERLTADSRDLTETVQYRHKGADGSWVHLESRMWNRNDSEIGGYVVSSRDVTDRFRAELRHRETASRLRELAANTDDVLWVFSADWEELLFVNEAFEDVWGVSQAEIRADPQLFLDSIHPDDRPDVRRAMRRLTAGEPVDIEYQLDRSGATCRWVWTKGRPVTEDGTVTRIVGFVRDVTDRRRRDRQLRVLDNLLRHNLRNVINVIVGHAEFAMDPGGPTVDSSMETIIDVGTEFLTTVEKERRVVSILVDSGNPTEIDLSAVLSDQLDQFNREWPEATLTADVPANASALAVPEIRHAIGELLENACAHASCPPEIQVELENGDGSLTVRITDNGPSIPGNEVEPLFSESNPSDVYHGTGLGLWLVYWTVDLSGGEIEFDRRADADGNVVTIRLPKPDPARLNDPRFR